MKLVIKHLFCFLFLLLFTHRLLGQGESMDSLKGLLTSAGEDTNQVNLLLKITEKAEMCAQDSMDVYVLKAKKLSEKLNFKKGMAYSCIWLSQSYWYQTFYDKTITEAQSALSIGLKIKNSQIESASLCLMGWGYLSKQQLDKSLKYFYKVLEIPEENANQKYYLRALMGISNLFFSAGEVNKADEFGKKFRNLANKWNDKQEIGHALSGIAWDSLNVNKYQVALELYFKALSASEEIGDIYGMSNSLPKIAVIYEKTGNYEKALDYYQKTLMILERISSKINLGWTLHDIGEVYYKKQDFVNAILYQNKSLRIADSLKDFELKSSASLALSNIFSDKKDFEKAYTFFVTYKSYSDSLLKSQNSVEVKNVLLKHEQDKKDALAKKEEELRKTQELWIEIICMVVFISLIAITVTIYRKAKARKKANVDIMSQKQIIEEKNKDITDSIEYALRIQQAKLPVEAEVKELFPESFIFFRPRDIVSGDFYFFHKNANHIFIAVADCTGHGVPGAFMSMIGSEKLKEAVMQTHDPSSILKKLNQGIKQSLKQTDSIDSIKDGMDIALCSLEKNKGILNFAGANRPLWLLRNGNDKMEEFKATKRSIGGFTENEQEFITHSIKVEKGDIFYIFSDGYADQDGGEKGKRLMNKNFYRLLSDIQKMQLAEQGKYLGSFIDNWRGDRMQLDDMLVMGVRL